MATIEIPKFTKVSEVWRWAAQNLKQGRSSLYSAYTGKYCALGAIGKAIGIPDSDLEYGKGGCYDRIYAFDSVRAFENVMADRLQRTEVDGYVHRPTIWELNDDYSDTYTFERLAEEAEKLGF